MPSIVRGVRVENLLSGRRFLLEWDLNPVNEGVTVYQIWRSTTEQTGFVKIGEVSSPTVQYIDKVPFTYGVTYFYKVVAVDAAGAMSDITAASAVSDLTFDSFEEAPFRVTALSPDSFVTNEVATGAVDGVNAVFKTTHLFRANSLQVNVNGVQRKATDFTIGTDLRTFTFIAPPAVGSVVVTNYIKI